MTFQELRRLRADHLKIQHNITLYPYQELVSDKILAALLHNLSVIKYGGTKELEGLSLVELAVEFSRQSGKTTAIVHTAEMIMTFVAELYKMPISIGIFAPQIEQARTDFDRLRDALRPIKGMMIQDDEQKSTVREQENAKTLVLPNGSSCWIAPVTTTSKPESKTFHLMLFEEAQDLDDKIVKEQIWPIGSTVNAPRIYIGTAGTRLCYFRHLGQSDQSVKLYFNDIVPQRKIIYDQTGDVRHLMYEKTVNEEITRHGLDSDEIQRPYFGKWLIGTGQFVTEEDLVGLETERSITHHENKHDCYVGIDTAKHPDSTVVTILRDVPEKGKREIIAWLELRGDNYQDQFDIINDFISRYRVEAIAIDSTGQGDFMPDMFEAHTEFKDENSGLFRVKFSMASKDLMYKNLKVVIRELLTELPKLDTKVGRKFKQQLLDLQQEYKGQFLSVKHPDDPNAHDDYPDSWALAEWAYASWVQADRAQVASVAINEPPRAEIVKDDKGRVVEHWPGDEDW